MTPATDTLIIHDEAALTTRIRNTQRQYAEAQTKQRIIAALAETWAIRGASSDGLFVIQRTPTGFHTIATLIERTTKATITHAPMEMTCESIDEALTAFTEMHGVQDWYAVK